MYLCFLLLRRLPWRGRAAPSKMCLEAEFRRSWHLYDTSPRISSRHFLFGPSLPFFSFRLSRLHFLSLRASPVSLFLSLSLSTLTSLALARA